MHILHGTRENERGFLKKKTCPKKTVYFVLESYFSGPMGRKGHRKHENTKQLHSTSAVWAVNTVSGKCRFIACVVFSVTKLKVFLDIYIYILKEMS